MSQTRVRPTTPRRTKSQVLREFRTEQLLDAAERVFAAQGFEGAGMDDVAREAGVAKGTLYLYYPSKEALYRAAVHNGLASLTEELERRVGGEVSVRAKIEAFVHTKLAYFEAHHAFYKLYSAALGDLSLPVLQRDCKSLHRRQLALLEGALRKAPRAENLRRQNPEAAASAIFDLTKGAILRRLLGRPRAATERDVVFLLELIWKGLAGQ